MNNKLTKLARQYWNAEESRDINSILSFFTADAKWIGPDGKVLTGHDQIRTFYESSAAAYPDLSVQVMRSYGNRNCGTVEWSAKLTAPDGQVLHLSGINIMKRKKDKFIELTAYFNLSAF